MRNISKEATRRHLRWTTPEKNCLSTLRGATYATSEVAIHSDRIVSWDRGWDNADKQVWGAVKSGYVFLKEKQWK